MARDTGVDWQAIAATEPWYGVLSAPEFLKRNLTSDAQEMFYAQGRSEMAEVVNVLETNFAPFQPKVGVDFGSGLGRLAIPMASICQNVWGLDVAPAMCEEATRQARARGVRQHVDFRLDLPEGVAVDWINSYIVFQHILPRTGYSLIQRLLERLNLGGHASVQFTFAHDLRDNVTLLRDMTSWRFDGETLTVLEDKSYEAGHMSMYDYDLNKVLMIFARAGVRDIHLRHTDHGGVHGFWVFGRRTI